MKDIEIIQWVKFNKPGLRQEIKNLVQECNTKMEFVRTVKDKYKLSITDANTVADNFFKKE